MKLRKLALAFSVAAATLLGSQVTQAIADGSTTTNNLGCVPSGDTCTYTTVTITYHAGPPSSFSFQYTYGMTLVIALNMSR